MSEIKVDKVKGRQAAASGPEVTFDATGNISFGGNISSTGDVTDFGDLTQTRNGISGSSNSTRGIFGGGYVGSTKYNIMDYITIASTGNATDFGDLTAVKGFPLGSSNGHGGLS